MEDGFEEAAAFDFGGGDFAGRPILRGPFEDNYIIYGLTHSGFPSEALRSLGWSESSQAGRMHACRPEGGAP